MLALVSGFIAGVSLGLTGGGGSILGVPLLVYVVGLSPHLAVGTSLVAVGVTALLSSLKYMRAGHVRVGVGLLMAVTGFAGVYLGSYANRMVSGPVLLLVFAAFMLVVGAGMVRDALNPRANREPSGEAAEPSNPGGRGAGRYARALLAGFGVGLLSGFLGVGGGFIIVPTLLWVLGLAMRDAVGTSLFIIFLNGIAGVVSYTLQGRPLDYVVTGFFVAGGALGGYLGAAAATRVSERTLKLAFAALVFGVAAYIIAANLGRVA
ncbi:MAG: sulfite exporter TauE/SafE family protein [Desulfurococcales archaeon]|nr:sulfite exporter TauE/SafE family protein [Desulfurococcales archaeon]